MSKNDSIGTSYTKRKFCKLKIQGFFEVALEKTQFPRNPRPGTKKSEIQGIPGSPGGVRPCVS